MVVVVFVVVAVAVVVVVVVVALFALPEPGRLRVNGGEKKKHSR